MGTERTIHRWVVAGGITAPFITGLCISLASTLPCTAEESPATRPSSVAPRPSSFDRAVVIPIHDEITDITRDSVRRRIKAVRAEGARLVIFDLNTPGGMVTSTLDICSDIAKLRDEGVWTCAWVNDKAYSGGTVIALAADEIVMAPNATIGDSQMIVVTSSGVEPVSKEIKAKMESPLLAELRHSARIHGYDMDLVLAFVDPELEVFWVENGRTGERRFVGPHERDRLFGITDAGRPAAKTADEKDDKHEAPSSSPNAGSRTEWRYVESAPGLGRVRQPIDGPNELLTLRTVEARAYGFAAATVSNEGELRDYLHITGPFQRLDTTWMEAIVAWLASPSVRGVLFLLLMMGAYAEFKAPGSVLPGSVALIALVLFLGAPYAAGFTVTWEIVAILAGIVLLALEIFVIPGFGIAGIAGIILLGIGLVASFVPREVPIPGSGSDWWPSPLQFSYLKGGLWALAGGLTGSLAGMALLARYFPKVPVAGRLILPNPTREQVTVDDPYEGMAQVGHIGRAEGPLRPAGKARFGALLVDVVSDGEFIPTGTRVEVIERAGSRVVVRRVD